jgi:hypothetical protein
MRRNDEHLANTNVWLFAVNFYFLSLSCTAELQAFDGLGPEVINSRLSMLGFAIAAFFELTQGLDVFQQVKTYPLLTVATFVIFTTASWIPFLQGQSYNVKSGPFTPAVSLCP